ncbi:MAG: CBS domain-containing protein [Chloroflexota bacterium]
MLANRISALPVVDGKRCLVGIITESDIFRMVVHQWRQSQEDSPKPFTHYESD